MHSSLHLAARLHRLAILLPLLGALALHGQNTPPPTAEEAGPIVSLDPYEVLDPAFARDTTRPMSVHTLYGAQLEVMNIANIEDSLKYSPNVFVRKRFIGDQNGALVIRGTHTAQSARSLVLADGLVLSNFLGSGHGFAPRWGFVAPEEVQKVDVHSGPYSAQFPGNAIGGVVLFTTGFPDSFMASVKTSLFFNDYEEYGTDDVYRGHTAAVSIGDRVGRFSWFAFYNRLENESNPTDYRETLLAATQADGTGVPVTGAFFDRDPRERERIIYGAFGVEDVTQDLFKVKVAFDFSETLRATASVSYVQRDVDTSADTYLRDASGNPVRSGRVNVDGRSFSIGRADFGLRERRETDLLYVAGLRGRLADAWDYALLASAFVVDRDTSRSSSDSIPLAAAGGPGQLSLTGRDQGWQSVDFKVVREFAGGREGGVHALSFGHHFDRYRIDNGNFATADWRAGAPGALLTGQTGRTDTHGFFIQDAWRINPRWSVTGGLRYEAWQASGGSRSTDRNGVRVVTRLPRKFNDEFSPKLALAWHPDERTIVRLSLAQAHRFATVGELYQGSFLPDGTVTNNNPDLRNEQAFSKDVTVERRFDGGGSARISLFEDDVDDSIFSQTNTTTRVTNFQNIDRVRTRGVEVGFDQRALLSDRFDLQGSVGYTESDILENEAFPASVGKRFPRVPRWRATLFGTVRATDALSFSAGARYASRQFNTLDNVDTRETYGGASGYLIFDTRATLRFGRGLTAALGVDNLTRERYYLGHNLLQRTYFTELKWSF